MRKRWAAIAILTMSMCLGATEAYSSVVAVQWIGPTGTGGSGNWSTAGDWSAGAVPNNGANTYSVTINSGALGETITVDISPTINDLTVGNNNNLVLGSTSASTLTIATGGFLSNEGVIYDGFAGSNLTVNGTTINTGTLGLGYGSTMNLNGAVENQGAMYTTYTGSAGNTLTVTGAFTNEYGAYLYVNGSGDVANIASLNNLGNTSVSSGATLNLTSQPNGITDVASGSTLTVTGTLNAGANNGLYKLTSVEGTLTLNNGTTTAVTPTGGTLSTGYGSSIRLGNATTMSITGNVDSQGAVQTTYNGSAGNTFTVSGTYTNEYGASLSVNGSGDVANISSLNNLGNTSVSSGATLNLTSQPNGITDVPSGSALTVTGTLNAGANNGLYKLTSVEGTLTLNNGTTTAVTPTGGTLSTGYGSTIGLGNATTMSITGNVDSQGNFQTTYSGSAGNTLTLSGTYTNEYGATLNVSGAGDTVNVKSLNNLGSVNIASGATLNLTGGTGISDVPLGSNLTVTGTLKNGAISGLAGLTSVEGTLILNNGTMTAVTPTGGTLSTGYNSKIGLGNATTMSITGSVDSQGYLNTTNSGTAGNTLTVSGTYTNEYGGTLNVNGSGDTVNVKSLNNLGYAVIGPGATLNITGLTGITTIAALSRLDVGGTLKLGASTFGLAGLTTVGGSLYLYNGGTTDALTKSVTVNGSGGVLGLGNATTVSITGGLTDYGTVYTTGISSAGNTLKVGGTTTVAPGGSFQVNGTGDVANLHALTVMYGGSAYVNGSSATLNITSLTESGTLVINSGDTLNMTGATLTTLPLGSTLDVYGTFKKGAGSGLATLTTLAGSLIVSNGTTNSITPGGTAKTLTVTPGGYLYVGNSGVATTVTVNGNLVNESSVNSSYGSTLTVTGTLTNRSNLSLNSSGDTVNAKSLVNYNSLYVAHGATLNITGPTGFTDVAGGSSFNLQGTTNALNKLASIEGTLYLLNGVTDSVTPGSGTLSLSGTGVLYLGTNGGTPSTLSVTGNVNNNGTFYTGYGGGGNTVNVSGTFTNGPKGALDITGSGDTVNATSLVNYNSLSVAHGATLNITGPTGLTDIVGGSSFSLQGTTNALNKLASIEGTLYLQNGATDSVTPGSGTLSLSGTGVLYFGAYNGTPSTLSVTGNVNNNGYFYTGYGGGGNTVNVSGAFNNGPHSTLNIAGSGDVVNVASLSNLGSLTVNPSTTLNITGPTGLTDIAGGSSFNLQGTTNALGKLASIEGTLYLLNGATDSVTPGSGTLSVSRTGQLYLGNNTTLSVTGNLNNNYYVQTTYSGGPNTLNVSGAFTNGAFGNFYVNGSGDVANVGSLNNLGYLTIASGATLNITGATGLVNSLGNVNLAGHFTAAGGGAASGIANLTSVQGPFSLNNGLSNAVTPNGGTLTVGSAGSLTIYSGTTLAVTGGLTNQGSTSNSGKLTVSGTLSTLPGSSFYTNSGGISQATTLSNEGYSYIYGGGLLGVGTGSISGTGYDQLSNGTWNELISSTNTGYIGDSSNAAVFGGTLNVQLQGGFIPGLSSMYDIMDFGSSTGTFATFNGSINGSEHFTLAYNLTNLTLTVVAGPAPTLRDASPAVPTPEPSGLLLLGTGLMGILLARRRRTRPAGPSV